MNAAPNAIDAYIAGFPPPVQLKLQAMRDLIKTLAPDAIEVIKYAIPTFVVNGINLVHFAGYQHHIGFYPIPSSIAAFEKELSVYKKGKGSVQFPIDEPLPFELIRKMTQFRLQEIALKQSAKKKKSKPD
jgi:uncharacterized protein YdhG (YjbR/CyaY superfamily)